MDFLELVKTEKVKPYKITILRSGVEMIIDVN